jgi:hypothetical protein
VGRAHRACRKRRGRTAARRWYRTCVAVAAISGLQRVQQLPPTASEELPTTPISVIAAVEPMTSAHHLGGTPHTADLPQGR